MAQGPVLDIANLNVTFATPGGDIAAARDRDVLGTRLSYWTDNGSAYWYRTEPGLDAAATVVAAVDDLEGPAP